MIQLIKSSCVILPMNLHEHLFKKKTTANPAYIIANTSTSSATTETVYTEVLIKFPNSNILTSVDEYISPHNISPTKNELLTLEDESISIKNKKVIKLF